MAPAFSKEAILQGSIDHLCLVCESYLRSERDVCLHVATTEHTQNLHSTDYVEKYRNDRVRKVKKWYFCEFCNVLVSTLNYVKLHVEDPSHVAIRSQTIARVDDVIVSGNTAINEDAWQGLVEETCIICNVEYEDQDAHRNEAGHIINLIQSKVSDNCYRKIDDSTFHCLTCNEVVAEITEHLDGTKHKQALKQPVKIMPSKHEEDKKNIKSTNEKSTNASVKDNHQQSSDILDFIPLFQKNNININLESRTAVCKRCSLNIEFDCKEIENHIEQHKSNVQKKKSDPSPVLFRKDEKNKGMDNGTLYTSPISRTTVREKNESAKTNSTETTNQKSGNNEKSPKSSKNNEIEKKNGKCCNLKKVPSKQFYVSLQKARTGFAEDLVVNDKYCIDVLSFCCLKPIGPARVRCEICGLNLSIQDAKDHPHDEHDTLREVPVIIHPDLEFIREVRSDMYHCGYCNVIDTWEGIETHLKSSDHEENKSFAEWRLSEYLPEILQRRKERHLEALMMMHLLLQ